MTKEFKLPELGENIEEADVLRVLVSEGDTITEDQSVLELETEKATVEVPAPFSGTIKKIHVQEGDKIQVGQLLLTVEDEVAAQEEEREETPEAEQKEVVEEEEAETGEARETAEVAKEEAVEEEEAEEEAAAKPKEKAPAEKVTEKEERVARKEEAQPPEPPREVAPAAPSVRRLARELGINIQAVRGSGPEGRISTEDVKKYARQRITEEGVGGDAQPTLAPLPDFTQWGEVERKPMSNIRRKTAENLGAAWSTVPHVTQYDEADSTELEQLRKRFAGKVEEEGGKLTVTALLLKVIVSALKIFPQFNASVDMANKEIIYKKYYHIGVAVDTDRGLLVPVIRDVDKKNLVELSVELTQVAEKARNKKLTLEEMQGGTFTITNLGGLGGTNFSPIVYAPEVAILGVARARMKPVYLNGQFEPRLILPLSLSYDHRVIDGADGVRFLRWVVEALQQPFLLTLEG